MIAPAFSNIIFAPELTAQDPESLPKLKRDNQLIRLRNKPFTFAFLLPIGISSQDRERMLQPFKIKNLDYILGFFDDQQ